MHLRSSDVKSVSGEIMTRIRNHQVIGKQGAYELLGLLEQNLNLTESLIVDKLSRILSSKETSKLTRELLDIAFIRRIPQKEYLELTDIGREAFLLAKVINGASLDSVVNQLSRLRARQLLSDYSGYLRMLP